MVNIPADTLAAFKAAQASVFQDQDIDYFTETKTTDANGSVIVTPSAAKAGTITDCNISEDLEEADITAYGLVAGKSIRITRSADMALIIGLFVKYNDRYYRVKAERKSDFSHTVYCDMRK